MHRVLVGAAAVGLLLVAVVAAAPAASPVLRLVSKWGSQGSGQGQFQVPRGIDVAPGGDVYVADMQNNRVQRFTAEGKYVASFAVKIPAGVAAADDGRVYTTEPSRVDVFASDGKS